MTGLGGFPLEGAAAWDVYAETYQAEVQLQTAVASYGLDVPDEAALRLLGDLKGKRVLDLGCGAAQAAISFARQGATAVGVDFSAAQLAMARGLAEAEEVRLELRQGDLADLAFMRADSADLVFSAFALHYVEDLNRVFRQVHRVLKVGAPLVFSVPHPAYQLFRSDHRAISELDTDEDGSPVLRRSYFDTSPVYRRVAVGSADILLTEYPRSFSDIYLGLVRASYRVELVLEPEPTLGPHSPAFHPAMEMVPSTLIIRARKEGN